MSKTARDFALARSINLGRHANGHYYIAGTAMVSMYPTAKSAIVMMRRFVEVSK